MDGEAVDFSKQTTYKGLMVSDVPNMVVIFGYINASWTLRADLAAEWVCRALNHMSSTQTTKMVPVVPESLKDMPTKDWIADFPAGYMQRSMHLQPRQGDQAPWVNSQNFRKERALFGKPIESDGGIAFYCCAEWVKGYYTSTSHPRRPLPMNKTQQQLRANSRLSKLAAIVEPPYTTIWDCCCDHGLLGMALLKDGYADEVIFVDIVEDILANLTTRLERSFPRDQYSWQVRCEDLKKHCCTCRKIHSYLLSPVWAPTKPLSL